MTEYTHIINGKPITSPKTLDVINPATQKKIAEVPIATKEQLDEAVAAARAALPGWAAKSEDERAGVLVQIAEIIGKNMEEYKQLLTSEQGKTLSQAGEELGSAILWLRETAKLRLPDNVIMDNEQMRVVERRVPIGVCAGIVPWNFPVFLCSWKLASALLAGNTFIIKPSPFTPLTTLRVKDICSLVPPGVINVLSGDDGLGPLITAHPGIDKVSFTGSTATGKKVMESASTSLKRVTLELGGNDPAIILPDVDVTKLAPELFWVALVNNGQASKRLYIHEKIYDQLRDELVKIAKSIKTGNGADPDSQLGPIQNILQYKRVVSFFDDAHANGYKFALGGEVNPNPTDGLFVPISIVDNPPENSKIVREEPFGPIVPLLKWNDEQDVIKRANDTKYGLTASVWGKDLEALERIAKQIQSGTVCINGFAPVTPFSSFGGHKESGLGVESGLEGLKTYANIQTLTYKKSPAFV
ncbi:Aldehyde dehydrogenase [Ceratobasidium theobromae]|uniref:Aldehyde dehydrogenase n=1 Tax=Ceratobasidium theobromae TaxID=1582974 RepID=A0A5N5QDS4_9AGAM|nr:Aldehyde dehydrogenase [Ceratobasidium theobromae]